MKQTINVSQFRDAFQNMNRKENFSYAGLGALFDYLEEYEDSTGEELELDVIALCCEYSEYESLEEFQNAYSSDYESIEDIEQATTVIHVDDDSFIIQDF
jgi:hypothetical protein